MNALLLANIKKSLRIIVEENPEVPDYLIDMEELGSEKTPAFSINKALAKVAAKPIPSFYHDITNELRSPQETFFGFYVLRNTIRGIFLGLRSIQAGDLLQKNDFHSAAVLSYYSASFHLLLAFLSLNGRIIVDNLLPIKLIAEKEGKKFISDCQDASHRLIIAKLTHNNKWKFENLKHSHKRIWKDLENILLQNLDEVPEFFLSFFNYVLYYENTASITDLVKKGVENLIEFRHDSIYRGYGYDDIIHDAITNRDYSMSWDIGRKATRFRDFAIGLLRYSTHEFLKLREKISPQHFNSIRILLMGSVIAPPFELGDSLLPDKPQLTKAVTQIYNCVMKTDKNGQRS